MKQNNTTPTIDALNTLAIMADKLALISYALMPNDFKIEESALGGVGVLIEELGHNVGELTDYCQEAEHELIPLKRDIEHLHPDATRIFGLLARYDKDYRIQSRLLKELNAKEEEEVKS